MLPLTEIITDTLHFYLVLKLHYFQRLYFKEKTSFLTLSKFFVPCTYLYTAVRLLKAFFTVKLVPKIYELSSFVFLHWYFFQMMNCFIVFKMEKREGEIKADFQEFRTKFLFQKCYCIFLLMQTTQQQVKVHLGLSLCKSTSHKQLRYT